MNRNIILVFGIIVGILTMLLFFRSNLDRSFRDALPIRNPTSNENVGQVEALENAEEIRCVNFKRTTN